jgi:hypothetical protein
MATYYRIDEWNSKGNSSKIHFENNLDAAMGWVSGMNQITAQETEGIEHTSIQQFEAQTCDMEGWNNSDADQTTPIHFA